jgi:ShET2 enterotoxin, N-terminal region
MPNATGMEAGLRAQLQAQAQAQIVKVGRKGTPKISKSGDSQVRLNCVVSVVANRQDWPGPIESVACRHFAHEFSTRKGKKSLLLPQFSSVPEIKRKFVWTLHDLDRLAKSALKNPGHHKNFLEPNEFGHYLTALAQALDVVSPRLGGAAKTEVNCLLCTDDHAMAIHLERKLKNNVHYFAVKLYDPNRTASYMRVESQTPGDLSHLTLSDMLIDKNYKPQALVAICLDKQLQPQPPEHGLSLSSQGMRLALQLGLTKVVGRMLVAAEKKSPQTLAELFSGFHAVTGGSGLFIGFDCNHVEAVTLVVDTLLKSKLPPLQKTQLLMAMSKSGDTGLYRAFSCGYTEMIEEVTQLVLASNEIDPTAKVDVLSAWSKTQSCTGLHEVFRTGQTPLVEVFTQLILACPDLSEDQKIELLKARNANGVTGLTVAQSMGNTEATGVFLALVEKSNLSPRGKAWLSSTPYDFRRQ